MLTDSDRHLLRQLLAEPDQTGSELAERCVMTAATAGRRLDRLRVLGILKRQSARINWQALGYSVKVSLRFSLDKTNARAFDEFLAEARKVPEVVEIQTFLGRVDVRLAVIARDMAHYQDIYRSRILTLPHIADIEALVHVATIKSVETLPI